MNIQNADLEIKESLYDWCDHEPCELHHSGSLFCYSYPSQVLDCLPGASTIVNLFEGVSKYFSASSSWDGKELPAFSPLTRENRGYWRHILLCVPFVGNVIVAVCTLYAKFKAENILKSIPGGTSLYDEHVQALREAAGYGSMEAMVRLAQYYVWNGCPKDMDEPAYCSMVCKLYKEACDHGNKEAQEWDAKWKRIFQRISAIKSTPEAYQDDCLEMIHIAHSWIPGMQEVLPVFEKICSFCFQFSNQQTMLLLKKLCNKVEEFHTCDTVNVRAKIHEFEEKEGFIPEKLSRLQITDLKIENLLRDWKDYPLYPMRSPGETSFSYSTSSLILDYFPGASTIYNLSLAIIKCFRTSRVWDGKLLPCFNPLTRECGGYWRNIVLSVPLIGNLIIILYDSHAKTKAENILKSIPAGTSLSDENIKALKQAIGYGSAAAMVRLAQFYLWHPDRNDMEVDTYERATSHLYKEAWKHGHKEAQEWSKWSFYLTPIIKLKQTMMVTSEFMRERAFKNALYQAEVWTPEMQKQLPTFEGICSFCFRYPTPQKMTLLRKLCDKVEKNHTCDTAQVREKIATFEKLSVDGTLVSLE